MVESVTPGERAAPAGVGRTNHPGIGIGEQDRRAIGGQDSEQDVLAVGDHGVGLRPLGVGPGMLDRKCNRRMHLVHRNQLGARADRIDGPPTILVNRRSVIVAAIANIQPRELAGRNARRGARESRAEDSPRQTARMTSTPLTATGS